MEFLKVVLEEGFVDDTVVVRVNDEERFRQDNVNTMLLLNLADEFELEVPEGQVQVEVNIPSRRLSDVITLEGSKPVYLYLSIAEGRILHDRSDVERGHL